MTRAVEHRDRPDERYPRVRSAVAATFSHLDPDEVARLTLVIMETDRSEAVARRLVDEVA